MVHDPLILHRHQHGVGGAIALAEIEKFRDGEFRQQHQGAAQAERGDHADQRGVAVQRRRHQRDAIRAVPLRHPALHMRPALAVRLHDAFRPAGGAAAVDQVERIIGADRHVWRRGAGRRQPGIKVGQCGIVEEQRGIGIDHHGGDGIGCGGLRQRRDRQPGAQGPQPQHQIIRLHGGGNGDAVALAQAFARQRCRHPVNARIECRPTENGIAAEDRRLGTLTGAGANQIGEGCELVNGIIGVGCRIFYGVKAVRFFMASHSQLKYGARLINSYLGNNATISCCEVLNSLIYPFHEQHHNNSFLCASLLMGQSNVAAGATIGSNHNSRGADGELVAGRGFWPGLCVSLKHNSRFASFSLLAKGDFPFELNIPIPFSLIINDPTANELRIIPAYWFQYNHYALQRNEWKYKDRDARETREIALEYRSLAPDSINEIFNALDLLALFAGKAYFKYLLKEIPADEMCRAKGRELFINDDKLLDDLEILAEGFENSKRKVVILKTRKAYASFREMVRYYAVGQMATKYSTALSSDGLLHLRSSSYVPSREEWVNIGGQLVPSSSLAVLLEEIRSSKLNSWEAVHLAYKVLADSSPENLFQHALASLLEIEQVSLADLTASKLSSLFKGYLATNEKVFQGIVQSREKDMTNPFRKMVYANEKEMEAVLGKMTDNSFVREKDRERKELSLRIENIQEALN